MAAAARTAGYDILGFSSHAPLGPAETWTMRSERLQEYRAGIRRLGRAWAPGGDEAAAKGPMEILLGLEIDWIPGRQRPRDGAFAALEADYFLGCVHFAEAAPGSPFTVDCNEARFAASLAEAKKAGGDARALYRDYYRRLGDLIEDGGFDILGHFDLVKKNNAALGLFDEEGLDYLDAAFEAASHLVGKDLVVEVNLGGMARGKTKEPYPGLAILRELRRLERPITFCADAHAPEHLGAHLDVARSLAKAAGYDSIAILSKGKWTECGIDET